MAACKYFEAFIAGIEELDIEIRVEGDEHEYSEGGRE